MSHQKWKFFRKTPESSISKFSDKIIITNRIASIGLHLDIQKGRRKPN